MPRRAIDVDLGPFVNIPSGWMPARYVRIGQASGGFYMNGRYDRYGVYAVAGEHLFVQWHTTVFPEGGSARRPMVTVDLDTQPYLWSKLGLFRTVTFFVDEIYGLFLPEHARSYVEFLARLSPIHVADLGLGGDEL